ELPGRRCRRGQPRRGAAPGRRRRGGREGRGPFSGRRRRGGGRLVGGSGRGVTNVARDANLQGARRLHGASPLRGRPIPPVNVARDIKGVQVGLINVGGSEGDSFGLINIVPGGRYDVEAALDSSKIGTALFRHGGNGWHNVYGLGGHPVSTSGPNDDVWMYG